jgi:hypothetical protein
MQSSRFGTYPLLQPADVPSLRFAVQLLRQLEQRIRDELQPGSDGVLLLTLTPITASYCSCARNLKCKSNGSGREQFFLKKTSGNVERIIASNNTERKL